jgi:hypothetical protein
MQEGEIGKGGNGRLLCSVPAFHGDQSRDSDSASCYAWHSSVNLATSEKSN